MVDTSAEAVAETCTKRKSCRRHDYEGAREMLTTSGHVVHQGHHARFSHHFSTIAGVLLGLRFKVSALIPATLLAAGVVIVTGGGLGVVALTVFGTIVLLQIGYFAGRVVQFYTRAVGTNGGARLNPPGRDRQH